MQGAGRRVVYIKDVPKFNAMPSTCMRVAALLSKERCFLNRTSYDVSRARYNAAVNELARAHPNVMVVDPTPLFCNETRCLARHDSGWLYEDDNHLSSYGSQ